ncbi:MAG: hypothetical protein E5W06_00430 [Mesorhizobium sp.]|nr:MAG: hypothetical protein E5W06_00430 [Mesorhizobium sp.]
MHFSRMMSIAVAAALGQWPAMPIAPRFELGPKNYHARVWRSSRYMPHQGKRECARRLRRMGA